MDRIDAKLKSHPDLQGLRTNEDFGFRIITGGKVKNTFLLIKIPSISLFRHQI